MVLAINEEIFYLLTAETTHRTPHALQWAVRNAQRREAAGDHAAHVYVSNTNIGRNAAGASAAADASTNGNTLYCMPSALARTFSLIMKEV